MRISEGESIVDIWVQDHSGRRTRRGKGPVIRAYQHVQERAKRLMSLARLQGERKTMLDGKVRVAGRSEIIQGLLDHKSNLFHFVL